MRSVTREQRRARLAHRHHLAQAAESVTDVVGSLAAVHSSDPTAVFLSMWARVRGFSIEDLETELYETRNLIRHWGMRRTLWVVDREMLPEMIASATHPIGVSERKRTAKLIEQGQVSRDGEAWLQAVLPKTLEHVRTEGPIFTRELTRQIPELSARMTFTNKAGRVMGTTAMSSRALLQLGMESKVVRARPAGTWVSGQYSWAAIERWLDGEVEEIPERDAAARVVERWLRAFGPGTQLDLRWWTGWTATKLRQALADVGAVEVDLGEDGTGFVLADDLDEVPIPDAWVSLLPSLDTTTMAWKERDFFLGGHDQTLFDRNGNAGPTVWVDGRVVGGWAQRKDGQVVYELVETVGRSERSSIEAAKDRLQEWLGPVTVTPRFRSPMDKRLAP